MFCLQLEDAPCLSQRDPAPLPLEQLDPQFLLQLLDVLRERRLRNVQTFCRAGDVEVASDFKKVPKMPILDHVFNSIVPQQV
jgi:uncharacterized protein YjaG (DUF416 family)